MHIGSGDWVCRHPYIWNEHLSVCVPVACLTTSATQSFGCVGDIDLHMSKLPSAGPEVVHKQSLLSTFQLSMAQSTQVAL